MSIEDSQSGSTPPSLRQPPPFLTKLKLATLIYLLQGLLRLLLGFREWREYFNRPATWPDLVKKYPTRPSLPVRIFYPSGYERSSAITLPTLITIHGGSFCIGEARDDDEWNRQFADMHGVMVVALEYSKAPRFPFPAALHDLEALILAVLDDKSLPIRRRSASEPAAGVRNRQYGSYTAVLGFSAGGNLATAVTQLPSLLSHPDGPMAVVSVYGCVDMSRPTRSKTGNRPYKSALAGPRGSPNDVLLAMADVMDWSYIPYGQDMRDPLVSPLYAKLDNLPSYVGFVGAELDMLSYEDWQMACRLRADARLVTAPVKPPSAVVIKRIPDPESEDPRLRVLGKAEVGDPSGPLEGSWDSETRMGERDERFGWEEEWTTTEGRARGLKWLLVPDVLHGFDNQGLRDLHGHKETIKDAEWKQAAYMKELGGWLTRTVWQV